MTDDSLEPNPPRRPWWRGSVVWGLVLSAAIAAYELTAQPELAVVTVGLKVGWGRFTVATWLLRRDPVRSRGWAGFWLYFGSGFWIAALTGFALMFAFPMVLPKPAGANPARDPVFAAFTGAALTWLVGTVLAAVALTAAVATALRHGLRFWLHEDVALARDRGEWPPTYGRVNRAAFPILVAILTGIATLLVVLGTVVDAVTDELGHPIPKGVGITAIIATVLVVWPVSTLLLWDYVKKHVLAREPWEFWNDPVPVDPDGGVDL